ncbi:AbiH family protein [Pedobacter sp. MC2016-05]|uniref:AbiH family protein n=1 Tax=Pedobacter sp. MC2016-05 TaxID=2994474 RepID=UPI002246D986|nr:AbiH family protein [Pedobacter sp. MC2016-05]MCX2476060.1 AbiH family protein [Pedobacter sp. MC2016-05]
MKKEKGNQKSAINRLILVGNGFDLAHGLKTGYNDFLLWYLNMSFSAAKQNRVYEDKLLVVSFEGEAFLEHLRGAKASTVSDFIAHFYRIGFRNLIGQTYLKFEGWANHYFNPFKIHIKSDLLSRLMFDCRETNWVEIENVFYELLKQALREADANEKTKKVNVLNQSLAELIRHLQNYLLQINTDVAVPGYHELLNSPFSASDFVEFSVLDSDSYYISSTQVLNFNYTDTIEKYVNGQRANGNAVEINYIHGKLRDEQNPVIFGFGDELDEDYHGFELEKTRGIFEYIKSFWYFRTPNYHNLIRFIDAGPFQVYILGHSCGLSDRTMLNMIFEHQYCRSVKIFYYQNDSLNNFTPLTQEIARHFKDKQQMRRKIVSFERSVKMPQVDQLYKVND